MWKVARKGLLAHKFRFFLTALSVLLGVAFVSGTFVFTATIQQTFDNLFTNIYAHTDAQVRAPEVFGSGGGFGSSKRPRIPASLLANVKRVPGVASAEGNVQLDYAQIVKRNGKAIGTPGQGAPTLGFGWNPDAQLSPWHLVAGGSAPANDDEIVIDRGSANKGHFKVGMKAEVLTSKPPKQYTISGIARFGDADNLAGASVVLFNLPEAQRIGNAHNQFDYINVSAVPGVSQSEVADSIRQAMPTENIDVVTGKKLIDESKSQVEKVLTFLNIGLLVFAFIALVVGAFIIYNTFSITVAQRSRETALLRAIGASRTQVLRSVIAEALIVGIFASAVGVVLGIGLAAGLRAAMSALGIDLPGSGVVVPAISVIVGLIVGIFFTLISSVFPAVQASRIAPVAAMRDVAIERPINRRRRLAVGLTMMVLGLAGLLAGLFGSTGIFSVVAGVALVFAGVFVLGPLYARAAGLLIGAPIARFRGVTGQIARENVGRNPRRTATVAAALMIGVALIALIAVFAASAKASFSAAIDSQIKSDYIVNSGGAFGGAGMSPQLGRQIAALPEIGTSTPVRIGMVEIKGSTQFIGAVDPQGAQRLFDLQPVAGSLDHLTDDGIVVSKKTADSHHWTLGSEVPVVYVKTGVQLLKVQMIYGVNNLAIPGDYLVSLGNYEKNFSDQLDVLIFAKLKPGVSATEGTTAITKVLAPYPTAKLQDLAEYKADQLKNLNGLLSLIYLLLYFSVIIAFFGVMITLFLSVYERTHEIGLLRAVGMSRAQVRSSIRWESVVIALLGTLLGLITGFFFGWVFVRALKDNGLTKFAPATGTLITVVVISFVLGILFAILPARRAAKLDVLRAIASE